jgi:nitrate/TMAO reductase-like tetraheme cytochrome c subunit
VTDWYGAARERGAGWARPLFFLGHNALTLAGAVLTTSSALVMIGFWALEVLGGAPTHPYIGIVLFLVLPGVFVLGLVLMPAGVLLRRRKLARAGQLPSVYPQVDFGSPFVRNAFTLIVLATILNAAILGTASYRSVEYMDSTTFCGMTCHSVMAPEFTAYADSPHSRVACVQCHIGPGAPWFVRSKLSGTRQLFAVALKTYSRPIPSPVHQLRPARETCEQCHWPQKFHGDKLVVRTKYADDEANTKTTTVLMLRIGGVGPNGSVGIHGRHLDTAERVRYVSTDGRRQVIPRVSYRDEGGRTVEFVSDEPPPSPAPTAATEHRAMDCIDCHNRPTHEFQLPERSVDRALDEGRISATLPFVKKKGVELLRAEYRDRETAAQRIPAALADYYRTSYPPVYRDRRAEIDAAAAAIRGIYLRNVFPSMKLGWGFHPNNIGHEEFPGCFRCHDDKHKSSDGRVITQDCNACHAVLAMDETDPKILKDLSSP